MVNFKYDKENVLAQFEILPEKGFVKISSVMMFILLDMFGSHLVEEDAISIENEAIQIENDVQELAQEIHVARRESDPARVISIMEEFEKKRECLRQLKSLFTKRSFTDIDDLDDED